MQVSAARIAVSVNHAIRTADNLICYRTELQPAAFLLALSDGLSLSRRAGVRVTTLVDCRTEAPATSFQAIATELDEAALDGFGAFPSLCVWRRTGLLAKLVRPLVGA